MSGALKWLGFGANALANQTTYQGIQVQSSISTSPIAIVYGQTRIAPNLIWYGNFQQTSGSGGKGGGKGGGGGKAGGAGATYTASVIMGVCEGTINAIVSIWVNKSREAFNSQQNVPQSVAQILDGASTGVFSLFNGASGQAAWSYITSNYPAQARTYPNLAYIAAANYALDSSANLPNHNLEVAGQFQFTSGVGVMLANSIPQLYDVTGATVYPAGATVYGTVGGIYVANTATNAAPPSSAWTQVIPDANPAQIIFDLLTNTTYGIGIPAAYIASMVQYSNYCVANGLFLSLNLNSQETCSSIIQRIMEITNSEIFWSDGLVKIVPRGDTIVTGNGVTFTPNLTPAFNLTDDNIIGNNSDDPISLEIADAVDAFNCITINFTNRLNAYNGQPIQVKDQASIDKYGQRNESVQQHMEICDPIVAQVSAQLRLQRILSTRNVYTFSLPITYCMLEPMDLVTLNDPLMGVNAAVVRIISIEEDGNYNLKIEAQELMAGSAHPAQFNNAALLGYQTNYNQAPSNTNPPILFAPPLELSSNALQLWLIASGGTSNWGGCGVYFSLDNQTYAYQGNITGNDVQGVLSSALAVGSDPDTVNSLQVNMALSGEQLLSFTQTAADGKLSLCYVDGELISYETATLTGTNQYTLTYLRRGCYGTPIKAHAAGTQFAVLNGTQFSIPITAAAIGKTVYVKLPAFNQYSGGQQQIASVSAVALTVPAPPLPANVTGFSANQNGQAVTFGWNDILDDFALKGYDIGFAPQGTANWSAFELLTEATRGTEMTNAAVPPGMWTFAIMARDVANQLSATPAYCNLTVVNQNAVISAEEQDPNWFGTLNGLVRHWTGVLIPDGSHPCAWYDANSNGVDGVAATGVEMNIFVPDPVSSASYTAPTVDAGYTDSMRVYANIGVVSGVNQTGTPNYNFAIDTWLDGNSDPASYAPWTVGLQTFRYLNAQLQLTVMPHQVPVVNSFEVVVDKAPVIENVNAAVIAAGGTYIAFPQKYHSIPYVQVTVIGAGANYATASNVTATGCTINVWSTSGASVGGTVNYSASGD